MIQSRFSLIEKLQYSKLISSCVCFCEGIHNCVEYTQFAVSLETHRHCCVVVVGPEIVSPHEGSVPWSSPWGASICPAPRNSSRTCLPLSLTMSCLLYRGVCLPCILFVCPSSIPFPSVLPPSLPLAISLRPSLPPGAGLSLPLAQWPSLLGSQHWSAFTKRCLPFLRGGWVVFGLMLVPRYVVQYMHLIMYAKCNVVQENKNLHYINTLIQTK